MGSLNGDANDVVRAGRIGLRATDADRERIERALSARLGPHAFPPNTAPAPSARLLTLRVLAGAAVGACVIGGVLLASRSNEGITPAVVPTSRQVAHPATPPSVARDATPAATATQLAEPATLGPAEPTSSAPVVAPRRQDALTQEVALLSRAVAALNAGRAGEALATLNEHQRQFPHGILGAERQAAKAQALCSLGRLREGRAELAHLSPQSSAAGRAKQVCDAVAARSAGK